MMVLVHIAQHDTEPNFISMLPLAGHDGSLQQGFTLQGVDGKSLHETGSLQGVYNFAGFINTASADSAWHSCSIFPVMPSN